MEIFKPKILTTLKNYTKEQFIQDAIAGFVVAIIALPLSIALAVASGVSPEKGLHTAIIAGFLISLLGGSRVQIGGPTGAFMVLVYGIVVKYGIDGLITATFMAGIMIIFMGIFKLGSVIKYIPYPVTSGFTSGIAITILVSQLKDFMGITISEKLPAEFLPKLLLYKDNISTINYEALAIGIISLIFLLLWRKKKTKIPGALIVLIISSLIVNIFSLNVSTIGSTFTNLNVSLPMPSIPKFSIEKIHEMFPLALAIAILGSIESLLSAVVADGMISGKHRSNTELIAQGIANIASSIFGGLPATGAIARTVSNINTGGRTPIAGIFHSLYLFAIMIIFMPFAKMIPLSALASILIMVAINMGDWKDFVEIRTLPKSDALILCTVFLVTIFFDLVLAIEIGMVLASFLFMKRMADMTDIKIANFDLSEEKEENNNQLLPEKYLTSENLYVYEINGPFFFGAADKFIETIYHIKPDAKELILRMRYVNSIDATAAHALKRIINICKERNIKFKITELNKQPLLTLEKMGILGIIGKENIYDKF